MDTQANSSAPSSHTNTNSGATGAMAEKSQSQSQSQSQPETQSQTPNNGAKRIKVWRPPTDSHYIPPQSLPDSHFEPTGDEAQRAFRAQVSSREAKYEGPLKTKKLRDEEAARKRQTMLSRYPEIGIRIRFADRTLLECTLPSTSTIFAIYKFVRASLNDSTKESSFLLFQTPPRREFKETDTSFRGKSLLDLQFIPSTMFYIKFQDDKLNDSNKKPPLRQDLLDSIQDLPQPSMNEEPESSSSSSSNKFSGGGSSLSSKQEKLPKWLQKTIRK